MARENVRPPHHHDLDRSIAIAKILMLCFIAEHNLPFLLADHFTELCRNMFPDSEIAQSLHMKRTKCSEMAKQFGNKIHDDVVSQLRINKFFISDRHETDVSTTKCLSVLVKYFDSHGGTIKTRLLDLIDVYENHSSNVGSSGESLFEMIMHILNSNNIPLNNLVGLAADGASNIMGAYNSLSSRLRQHLSDLKIFKCTCHSIHLCASEASKVLPRQCEDLLRNIYTRFSHSAKRKYEFLQFQKLFSLKPHKLLHVSQTRWLSLHQAVERVLEQWEALKQYFVSIEGVEKLRSINLIVNDLNDPSIYAYFNFLNFILPFCNNFNLLFQRETPTIYLVHFHVNRLYKNTIQYFCRNEIVNKSKIEHFDPSQEVNHIPLSNIYLGDSVHTLLQKEEYYKNVDMVADIRRRCRLFMIKLCEEIKKRFQLQDDLWEMASLFNPEKVLDPTTRDVMPSLAPLVAKVPRLYDGDLQTLDNEWRHLDSTPIPLDITPQTYKPVDFYLKLGSYKFDNTYLFKSVATFALNILALPVTNTDAERLFSKLNLIKTDVRNSLSIDSVKALTYISESVKEQGCCYNFQPSENLMNIL
ncbi:uncharacterized protein LOC135195423 [Macrobrachium nipponense]|uniref:uncharacterized protein LOC135195423 n=1 Tax=Macrobrachium nipponense TaxID=159736 RepID=UPI0030C7A1D8